MTVDGQQAYAATTPKTLGCVPPPFAIPAHETNVCIELAGAIVDKDDFGIVEVIGKKLEDTGAGAAKGVLEIVEVEIYEPAAVGPTTELRN